MKITAHIALTGTTENASDTVTCNKLGMNTIIYIYIYMYETWLKNKFWIILWNDTYQQQKTLRHWLSIIQM